MTTTTTTSPATTTTTSPATTTTTSPPTTTTTLEDGTERMKNDYLYRWSNPTNAWRLFGRKSRLAIVDGDWPSQCHEGMLAVHHDTNEMYIYREAFGANPTGWYHIGGGLTLVDPSTTTTGEGVTTTTTVAPTTTTGGGATTTTGAAACPCSGDFVGTEYFVISGTHTNNDCGDCGNLDDNLDWEDDCTFRGGSSACAPWSNGLMDILLTFSNEGGNLVVNLQYSDDDGLQAEYEKTYTGLPNCNANHTLTLVSGTSLCSWASSVEVQAN